MTKTVCILAFQDIELLDLSGPQSAFSEANNYLPSSYEIKVIGFSKCVLTCEAGLQIIPSYSIDEINDCHTLIIPGGKGARSETISEEQLAALAKLMANSKRVVSICTGAFLVARAGMCENLRMATHWAHLAELKAKYPALEVESEKLYVCHGKYWSSAGVTAGIDLSLNLIEQDYGKTVSHHVAKHLVVYLQRTGGQKQFSDVLKLQTPKTNRMIFISNWIKEHASEEINVNRLAEKLHLSERQCHRFFVKETQLSPAQYVEKSRMMIATELLVSSERSLNAIASTVGFGSYEGFRRAFERNFSVSPAAYRKSFTTE